MLRTIIIYHNGVHGWEHICTFVYVTASVIKIRQAVRQFHPQSFQQLRKFIPVGNQCGKCIRAAREVMQEELMQMPEFKEIA